MEDAIMSATIRMTSTTKRQIDGPLPRTETKADVVVRLLRRKNGASIADLQKVTGWQAHSVRGFLSGTVKKRMGLGVESNLDSKGTRRYRIAKGQAAQ
jgi:hypothetical protein